jgi:hypothetical protein
MIFDSGLLYYLILFGVHPAQFGRIPCVDDSISVYTYQPGCGVFSSCTSLSGLDFNSEAFSTVFAMIAGRVTSTSRPVRPS